MVIPFRPRPACREELITDHMLSLVEGTARRIASHLPPVFDLEDLCAAGMLGLVTATASFDPNLGVPFGAWAWLHIRRAIFASVRGRTYRAALAEEQLGEDRQYAAGPETRPDVILEVTRRRERIQAAIARLPGRERQVIEIHYLEGQTLAAAANSLGVGPSRASQLHSQALDRLRDDPDVLALAA